MSNMNQYQDLKCYQCGKNIYGQMTICINSSDPQKNDGYRRNGFTACCPEHISLIGTKPYFSKKANLTFKKVKEKKKKKSNEELVK